VDGGLKARRVDILICGGGMVGLSLALALDRLLPETMRIVLVEQFPLRAGGAQAYHPSFDARSTALSHHSRCLYGDVGVWQRLSTHAQPIREIHVSSRGLPGSALLDADLTGWPALGYVVENPWLGAVLQEAVAGSERVEIISPTRVAWVQPLAAGMRIALEQDGDGLLADLLVVADGADSALRDSLGIAARSRTYGQNALLANVATDRPHGGRAFERFTAEGPLALLPLCGTLEAANRSALVWTLTPRRAGALAACDRGEFLAALQRAFGYRLGRLLDVAARATYPLRLVTAQEQVRSRVVVLGNAAHALHPVAGQGFNLALRDADRLARVLAEAAAAGRDPGDLALLQRYSARQSADQWQTIAFSDLLPRLFMNRRPPLVLGRELGLSLLDVVPPAKAAFVRRMAGVAAAQRRPA